jgi:hypothetical protein
MAEEKVDLTWVNLEMFVPELPLSIEDRIKYAAPGWKVCENNGTILSLLNEKNASSIISSAQRNSSVTVALCKGEHGNNYEALRNIGETIKGVGAFYMIDEMKKRLAKAPCKANITCSGIPKSIEGYDCLNYSEQFNTHRFNKPGNPLVSVDKEKRLSKISDIDMVFPNFMNGYKYAFSRVFDF